MRIIAWSLNLTQEKADTAAKSAGLAPGTYTVVSREQLFAESDVLSIHLILSSRTRGLVTADDLRKMKPTALIVNTARGALVVEDDLLDALDKGLIAGAAIDVFEQEPLPANSRWRTTPWGTDGRGSVVLTPHSGYAFSDMLDAMWADTAVNVRRVLAGQEPLWRLDGK
jgi:glycerate dehydrogenase